MDSRILLILVAVIHISLCHSSSCSRSVLLSRDNLASSCEAFSRHTISDLEQRKRELERQVEVLKKNASCQITPNQQYTVSTEFQDCRDIAEYDVGPSGIYNITTIKETRQLLSVKRSKAGAGDGDADYLLASVTDGPFPVFCERVGNESWTVIMRRSVFNENFNRTFDEYKHGFGDANGDFWLGLEKIHRITTQPFATYSLWITMKNQYGIPTVFPYSLFKIEDESNLYKMQLTGYLGQPPESRIFLYDLDVPFRCWVQFTYSGRYEEGCRDYGHQQGGCWWFRGRENRLCGDNNIHDIIPYARDFGTISYVDMKIKKND